MLLRHRARSSRLPDLWSEFDRFSPQFTQLSPAGAYPRLNLANTEEEAFLTVEVPGLSESNLDLSVQGDLLSPGQGAGRRVGARPRRGHLRPRGDVVPDRGEVNPIGT